MGVLSQLIRRQPTTQSLVKAPSLGLIRGDDELIIPDLYIPDCLEPEEFKLYKESVGPRFDNTSFIAEETKQVIRKLDISLYPIQKVSGLLEKQVNYLKGSVGVNVMYVIWRPVTGPGKYEEPIPVRIIKTMKEISKTAEYKYYDHGKTPKGRFTISDLSYDREGSRIDHDRAQNQVCFLSIELWETHGYGDYFEGYANNNKLKHRFVIDAWRGPTFSDEEARLPGQIER